MAPDLGHGSIDRLMNPSLTGDTPSMDTQFESRLNRKRRLARQDRQIESRRRINQSIELINSEAPRASFATARMSKSQSLLDELNDRNKEEANLDARQKTGFVLRLSALL